MGYKDNTNKKLIELYEIHGLQKTLVVARKVLESKSHKNNINFHSTVHGELCETVLEIIIMDYMKRNPSSTNKWRCGKGLILKDRNNPDSDFLTEVDFILFTPHMFYVFECKSYAGNNKIIDKGIIKREKGSSFDVYSQNLLHEKVLYNMFEGCRTMSDGVATQKVLFDFSLGETKDLRSNEDKIEMPYTTEKTILNVLKLGTPITKWHMETVNKMVTILEKHSPSLRQKHLEYVKTLHKK